MFLSRCFSAGVLAFVLGPHFVSAKQVRIATYNVRQGVNSPGGSEYNGVRDTLQRIGADVVAFQELRTSDKPNWDALAVELSYPHTAFSGTTGLSGGLYTGYFSRYPIFGAWNVFSPPGANEISRPPFRVVVDVDGAAVPLVLWTLHHKAQGGLDDEFRRAVEGIRCVENIDSYLLANPTHDEFVVLGDFNDDVRQFQTSQIQSLPAELPQSYSLGADIAVPVLYRVFPEDTYEAAGHGMTMLAAFQEDSAIDDTFVGTGGRLDYVFVSDELANSSLGGPQPEVYNSAQDDGMGGLPKTGSALATGVSAVASDHYPVFVDVFMTDLVLDGIDGDWRAVYFGHVEPDPADMSLAGDDPDNDGRTNFEEYVADTVPTNGTDFLELEIVASDAATVWLEFETRSTRVYTLEVNDGSLLNPSDWRTINDFLAQPGNDGFIRYFDDGTGTGTPPGSESERTYRLRVALP
jgi:hypothetical protein